MWLRVRVGSDVPRCRASPSSLSLSRRQERSNKVTPFQAINESLFCLPANSIQTNPPILRPRHAQIRDNGLLRHLVSSLATLARDSCLQLVLTALQPDRQPGGWCVYGIGRCRPVLSQHQRVRTQSAIGRLQAGAESHCRQAVIVGVYVIIFGLGTSPVPPIALGILTDCCSSYRSPWFVYDPTNRVAREPLTPTTEFQIPPQVARYASFMFSFVGRGVCEYTKEQGSWAWAHTDPMQSTCSSAAS